MLITEYVSLCPTSPSGLVWIKKPAKNVATGPISRIGSKGYYVLNLRGKQYYAHRVVYYLTTGTWPDVCDHIDGNKLNNSPANLRSVNSSGNSQNRTRAKGYKWHKASGKWMASFTSEGVYYYGGLHGSEAEAREAYISLRKQYCTLNAL